ncbi:hypothetical protein BWR19_15230 [Halomonas sp. 1513]|nr:hypothetical protein BWR19_15230 [Halomonas sp. 1513]
MNRTMVRELLSVALMLSLGVAGLLHIEYGNWRVAPLVPSYIMPQTAYYFLIASGVWVLAMLGLEARRRRQGQGAEEGPAQDLVAIGLASGLMLGGAVVYFWMVLNLGLIVSTYLYNAVLIAVLAPGARIKSILLVPVLVAAAVWLLFIQMIGITLPPSLLF